MQCTKISMRPVQATRAGRSRVVRVEAHKVIAGSVAFGLHLWDWTRPQ